MTREEFEKKQAEENRKYHIEETFLMWWFVLLFVVLEGLGLWMLRNGCSIDSLLLYAFGITVVMGMVVGLYSSQGAESWKRKLDAFLCCGFVGWFLGSLIVTHIGFPVFCVVAINLGLLH